MCSTLSTQKAQTLRRLRLPRGFTLSIAIMADLLTYDVPLRLEGQVAVVIGQFCKLVGAGRDPVIHGSGGDGTAEAAAALAVTLGVAEIHVVGNHLSRAALAAVPIRPITNLKAALHHSHAALGEVLGNELSS